MARSPPHGRPTYQNIMRTCLAWIGRYGLSSAERENVQSKRPCGSEMQMIENRKINLLMSVSALGALVFIFVIIFYRGLSIEDRLAITQSSGEVTRGEMFGVKIGQPASDVISGMLKHGFRLNDPALYASYPAFEKRKCNKIYYSGKYVVYDFSDTSWRRGVACVVFLEGSRSVMLFWKYGPFEVEL